MVTTLPEKPVARDTTTMHEIIWLYAQTRWGKTRFLFTVNCVTDKNKSGHNLVLDFHQGKQTRNESGYKLTVEDWDHYIEIAKDLYKSGGKQFSFVSCDQLDGMYNMAAAYLLKKHNITSGFAHETDIPYKGTKLVVQEVYRSLLKISSFDWVKTVFVTSQETLKDIQQRSAYQKTLPGPLTGAANEELIKKLTPHCLGILFGDKETNDQGEESRVFRLDSSMFHYAGLKVDDVPDTIPADWKELRKYLKV